MVWEEDDVTEDESLKLAFWEPVVHHKALPSPERAMETKYSSHDWSGSLLAEVKAQWQSHMVEVCAVAAGVTPVKWLNRVFQPLGKLIWQLSVVHTDISLKQRLI